MCMKEFDDDPAVMAGGHLYTANEGPGPTQQKPSVVPIGRQGRSHIYSDPNYKL